MRISAIRSIKVIPDNLIFSPIGIHVIGFRSLWHIYRARRTKISIIPWRSSCFTVYRCQAGAIIECIVANLSDTFWNSDACQAGAIIECIVANLSDTFWNSDACQAAAILECHAFNHSNTVWDVDACEVIAIVECAASNLGYTFGDVDAF